MNILIDLGEHAKYLQIVQSDEYPTIDTEAIYSFILDAYMCDDSRLISEEEILMQCMESVSSVGTMSDDVQFQKLAGYMHGFIITLLDKLRSVSLKRLAPENFNYITMSNVWKDLYVIRFQKRR